MMITVRKWMWCWCCCTLLRILLLDPPPFLFLRLPRVDGMMIMVFEEETTELNNTPTAITTTTASTSVVGMDGSSSHSYNNNSNGMDAVNGDVNDDNDHHLHSSSMLANANASPVDPCPPPPPDKHLVECGLWLALSSIPGTGLGMFAGRDFMKAEHLQDTGDIAIPIVDIRTHASSSKFTGETEFLFDDYMWDSGTISSDFQIGREGRVRTGYASPGVGAAGNNFMALHNVDESIPTWNPHQVRLHRSRDPGAGAFSLYGHRTTYALRDIGAGEELFLSYGDAWFIGRPHLGAVPLTHDLDRATRLVYAFGNLSNVMENLVKPLHASGVLSDLWDEFVRGGRIIYPESRVLAAFNHSDPHELNHLLRHPHHNGGGIGMTLTELRTRQATHELSWLRQHGVCADHIRSGPSTLPQAGHGAFARRNLPQNAIVVSMPLIHIPDRSFFNMYYATNADVVMVSSDDESSMSFNRTMGIQLLTNYCFGHKATTMLLCPYGAHASYINHNQSLANVKLEWGDPHRGNHQPDYLNVSVEELKNIKTTKLTLHLVATRDIGKDEEIFLDYGDLWEAAWQKHVREWSPVPGSETYQYAVELNRDDKSTPLLSRNELEVRNLHASVDLIVHRAVVEHAQNRKHSHNDPPDSIEEYVKHHPEDPFAYDTVYTCDILSARMDDEPYGHWLYNASVYAWNHKSERNPFDDHDTAHNSTVVVVFDVPRQAFTYFARPYSSDTFLTNAFRHPMQLPDHLFPAKWRNVNVENK